MKKLLIFISMLFSAISSISGQEAVINKSKGEIKIYNEKRIELNIKQIKQIKEGYEIKTGRNSECEILLKDGTLLFVSENSHIKLEKGKLTEEERDFNFDFLKGKILFFINKIKMKINKVTIKTPTAVCAVRGTDFSIITSSETSNIGLFNGILQIEKDNQIKELKPGNEAIVSREIKISERLSQVMEKERKRAEKLTKYVERIRSKLDKRQESIDEKLNKNKGKLKDFFNKQKDKTESQLETLKKSDDEEKGK